MRSVNVAELKDRLSKYLTFAKGGEEVVIRERNLSRSQPRVLTNRN
jgi:antitoxin (DNA-binding transcriptional repressor) of toxin-antitoxin stability system